jgi:glycosyltransferase involved in cell wall biosynthesis
LISIIIPCFNQGRFLNEALDSICAQTYKKWEGIIVNDGSTDNTDEIALNYCGRDSRFRYIRKENGGLSAARNTGIANARGEFIQLLDADDLIEPDKLLTAMEAYQNDQSANIIVYTSMRYFEHDKPGKLKILGRNNFLAHVELKTDDELSAQIDVIRTRNICVISAPLYPREVFNKIGAFDEGLTSLEDWDFHIRCLNAGFKFHHYYKKHSLTLIRLHEASMTSNQKLLDVNFYKLFIKHSLKRTEEPVKNASFKKIMKGFIPPIVLKWITRL